MRIAFYAPMKAPDYPTLSGDRLIARLLLSALTGAGHQVSVASRFRSREGTGDEARQRRIRQVGTALARRLLRRYRALPAAHRPQLWFTYHLYHKAPDWLGPPVARALGIPYVLAEASFAPKQADGPWALGHQAAAEAIARADAIFSLNPGDTPCLEPLVDDPRRLVALKPFLDVASRPTRTPGDGTRRRLARHYGLTGDAPWLVAVAMMREGNKRDSYRLLAEALQRLQARDWRLIVIGDGPVRADVEAAFAGFAPGRVVFAGALAPEPLDTLVAHSDLFVWPGVREPIGMAMLEAQAVGVAVVSGRGPGIAGIVQDGRTGLLVPRGDPEAFAAAVDGLLRDPGERAAMGDRARDAVGERHDIVAAGARLDTVLDAVQAGRWP